MSDALIPYQEISLTEIQSVILSPYIEPADKSEATLRMLYAAACQQVHDETDEDSPWENPKLSLDAKTGMLEYQTWTRALAILDNLRTTLNINEVEIASTINRKRLDLFPPDGEWRDLRRILTEFSGGGGGRAGQIAQFIEKASYSFEAADVPAHQIAEIVQQHSRNDPRLSILAPMAAAGNKAVKTARTEEEKQERLRQIADDALSLPVNQFEDKYYGREVPRIPYAEQQEDDGSTLFVFRARSEREANLLRGRMRDAMDLDEGLFRPVTPSQIVEARQFENWDGLLKSAVLADRSCREVYGMLEAAGNICDREHFLMYSALEPAAVDQALQELVHYGLVDALDMGKKLWQLAK